MLYEFDHQQLQSFSAETSDEQLMFRIQARDEAALTLMMSRHSPLLRTVLNKVLNNSHDVDGLLTEVFLEVWERASSFDQAKGRALGWLVTLARRRAIDKVRRRQAYDRAGERFRLAIEQAPEVSEWQGGGDEQAIANERACVLKDLLDSLPEAQREVVGLAYYGGLSQREIAARLGTPLGTVKTRLELGIRKLRTALLASGGAAEWSVGN